MKVRSVLFLALAAAGVGIGAPAVKLTPAQEKERQTKLEKLEWFNTLIAEWRCDGVPPNADRNKFGWSESATFVWNLKGDVGIKFLITGGKYIKTGYLTYDIKGDKYTVKATRVDGQEAVYEGEFDEDRKQFSFSARLPKGGSEKFIIKPLDNIRMNILVEGAGGRVVAEIGGTKKGEKIAGSTDVGPKCVITGGPGTAALSHKGKSYYSCCSGCTDAFKDDPEKWIALAIKKGYTKE